MTINTSLLAQPALNNQQISSILASSVKLIRIVIPHGGGNGHDVTAVHMLAHLRSALKFTGKIELIYNEIRAEKVAGLFNLNNYFTAKKEHYTDKNTCFISAENFQKKHSPEQAGLIIMPARSLRAEGWLEDFIGRIAIGMHPYLLEDYIVFSNSHPDSVFYHHPASEKVVSSPYAIKWPISSPAEMHSALFTPAYESLVSKKPGLVSLAYALMNGNINSATVYGLGKYITDPYHVLPEYTIATLLLALAKIQKESIHVNKKPAILFLMNDFDNQFNATLSNLLASPELSIAIADVGLKFIALDVKNPGFEHELSLLEPGSVALTYVGSVPTEIFDSLFAHSTYTPVSEGASAAVTSLSKPSDARLPMPCTSRQMVETNLDYLPHLSNHTEFNAAYKHISDKLCKVTKPTDYDPNLYKSVAEMWEQAFNDSSFVAAGMKEINNKYNDPNNDLLNSLFNQAIKLLPAQTSKLPMHIYRNFSTAITENDFSALEQLQYDGYDIFTMSEANEYSPFVLAIMQEKYELAWKIFSFSNRDIESALAIIEEYRVLFPGKLFEKITKSLPSSYSNGEQCEVRSPAFPEARCSKIHYLNTRNDEINGEPYQSAAWLWLSSYYKLHQYKMGLPSASVDMQEIIRFAVYFNDTDVLDGLNSTLSHVILKESVRQSNLFIFNNLKNAQSLDVISFFTKEKLTTLARNVDADFFSAIMQYYNQTAITEAEPDIAVRLVLAAIWNPDSNVLKYIITQDLFKIKEVAVKYNWHLENIIRDINTDNELLLDVLLSNPDLDLLQVFNDKGKEKLLILSDMSDAVFTKIWQYLITTKEKEDICNIILTYPGYSAWLARCFRTGCYDRIEIIESFCNVPSEQRFQIPEADFQAASYVNDTQTSQRSNGSSTTFSPTSISENENTAYFSEEIETMKNMPEVRNVLAPAASGFAYGFTRAGLEEALKAGGVDAKSVPLLCDLVFSAYAVYSGNYSYAMPVMWRAVAHYIPSMKLNISNSYFVANLCWQFLTMENPTNNLVPLTLQLGSSWFGSKAGEVTVKWFGGFFSRNSYDKNESNQVATLIESLNIA